MRAVVADIRKGYWLVVRSVVGVRVQLMQGGPVTVNGGIPLTDPGDSLTDNSNGSFRIEADPAKDAVVLIVRGDE